jgi:hypothetical protein
MFFLEQLNIVCSGLFCSSFSANPMFLFDVGWMGYGMAGMGRVGGVTPPTHHFFPEVLSSMRSRFQAQIKEKDPYFLLLPLSTFTSIQIFCV